MANTKRGETTEARCKTVAMVISLRSHRPVNGQQIVIHLPTEMGMDRLRIEYHAPTRTWCLGERSKTDTYIEDWDGPLARAAPMETSRW